MANRVRETRERLGLTREALAERSTVSVRTLAYIESGDGGNPLLETAARLADALGTDIPSLFPSEAPAEVA